LRLAVLQDLEVRGLQVRHEAAARVSHHRVHLHQRHRDPQHNARRRRRLLFRRGLPESRRQQQNRRGMHRSHSFRMIEPSASA
jgi:hypothetical protein